ncbi:MAG: hypothetical protein LRZ88_01845 [Candidatus Cloacimonetes bacterium]|nr:hypothetical protein [Candidatus Cloacimonadota bacterium]
MAKISIDKRFGLVSDAGELADICNAFFKDKLDQDRLYYRQRNPQLLQALENTLAGLEPNTCLIRFGKGTGSIHKSINKHQPQTRSLIGGLALGICKLSFKEL